MPETTVYGTFELEIRGRPVSQGAVNSIRAIIDHRVDKISNETEIEIKKFSDLALIIKWKGKPDNIGKAQSLLSALNRMIGKYFTEWEFTIKIRLVENWG